MSVHKNESAINSNSKCVPTTATKSFNLTILKMTLIAISLVQATIFYIIYYNSRHDTILPVYIYAVFN